jgi:hypothetical protein
MGTVHRNGIPPKRLPFKKVQTYSDMEFNEELITKWAREQLENHMQYDIVVFNGTKGKLNRSIEFTAWFQTKIDAERFQKKWMK